MKLLGPTLALIALASATTLALPAPCRKAASLDPVTSPSTKTVIVAAIQADDEDPSVVHDGCDRSQCAFEFLITRASGLGAQLVVTPEAWLDQDEPEPEPALGERPETDPRRPLGSNIALSSSLARRLGIYLVVHVETCPRWYANEPVRSSLIAFDPDGRVVGVHHKFELFQGEKELLEPGEEVMVFETPFGKVGMLVCSDLYGDPRRHDELTQKLGARIIAFSTMWLVDRAAHFQAAFAHDWNVYLIAANKAGGPGSGGGIYDPTGRVLAQLEDDHPGVVIAAIPAGPSLF